MVSFVCSLCCCCDDNTGHWSGVCPATCRGSGGCCKRRVSCPLFFLSAKSEGRAGPVCCPQWTRNRRKVSASVVRGRLLCVGLGGRNSDPTPNRDGEMEKNHQHGLTAAGKWGVFAALEELTSSDPPRPDRGPRGGSDAESLGLTPFASRIMPLFVLGKAGRQRRLPPSRQRHAPLLGFARSCGCQPYRHGPQPPGPAVQTSQDSSIEMQQPAPPWPGPVSR